MASRKGRAFYEKLLEEVEAGSSVADVAHRHGIRPKTLSWWLWRLRQSKPKRRGSKRMEKAPALVPVVVRAPVLARGHVVELSLGHLQLAFEVGTDPDYLARLARSLRDAC